MNDKIKILTGKDEKKAREVAFEMINNSDVGLFEQLTEKEPFLFDFVRNNVCSRIYDSVNRQNFENIFRFFKVPNNFEELFAQIAAKFANEELSDRMAELLRSGSLQEKKHAAAYFAVIPDTVAREDLAQNVFAEDADFARLCTVAARETGAEGVYEAALEKLNSGDDFEILKAVDFFVNYEVNPPVEKIVEVARKSFMSGNIAGKIPYLISLVDLYGQNEDAALFVAEKIIDSLAEIIPLSEVLSFDLRKFFKILNLSNPKTATVLLKAKSRFEDFTTGDVYLFDEDKYTKDEILKIRDFLASFDVDDLKNTVVLNLTLDKNILSYLDVIKLYKITEASEKLKLFLNAEVKDNVLCGIVFALKELNALSDIDETKISAKIRDFNLRELTRTAFE